MTYRLDCKTGKPTTEEEVFITGSYGWILMTLAEDGSACSEEDTVGKDVCTSLLIVVSYCWPKAEGEEM